MQKPPPPAPGGPPRLPRRDALLAGLAFLGGGAAATGLLRAAPAGEPPGPNPLELPDDELLCQAEGILLVAEHGPPVRRLELLVQRLLTAALRRPSPDNDLAAARCLFLLARMGKLSAETAGLAARAQEAPIARMALRRLGRAGEGGDHAGS